MNTNLPTSTPPTSDPFAPTEGTLRATLEYLALSIVATLFAGAYILNWPAFVV